MAALNRAEYGHGRNFLGVNCMFHSIKNKCVWSQDSEDSDIWLSSCAKAFVLNVGTPKENQVKYCVYCGKLVEQKTYNCEGIDNGLSRTNTI